MTITLDTETASKVELASASCLMTSDKFVEIAVTAALQAASKLTT